jgi:hypothetical protein
LAKRTGIATRKALREHSGAGSGKFKRVKSRRSIEQCTNAYDGTISGPTRLTSISYGLGTSHARQIVLPFCWFWGLDKPDPLITEDAKP